MAAPVRTQAVRSAGAVTAGLTALSRKISWGSISFIDKQFITTSNFTRDAQDYADLINTKIILIDGERLSSLLVDHNVGVTPVGVYEIKRIDTDYFEGEL